MSAMNGRVDPQPLFTSRSRLRADPKIPRTRRWRVTNYGRNVMGTSMYIREHHFPNVYSGVVH